MKLKLIIILALAATAAVIAAVLPNNDKDKESLTLQVLMAVLERMHFQPTEMNDETSEKIYTEYLKGMDTSKRFLLQSDVDQLEPYRKQLDNEILASTFEFFDKSNGLMENAITRTKAIYESLKNEEIEISKEEDIELDGKKLDYATDEEGIKDRWRKLLKYNVVTRLDSYLSTEADKKEGEERKTQEELKAKAQKNTFEMYDDFFDRLEDIRRSDRFEVYVNEITHAYDPHTTYFSPKSKEDFDLKMGGRLEGIGARLSAQDDYTEVVSIVPGGPAYKAKNLAVEDLITAVRQEDEEEATDVIGMRLDDVVQLIRGPKGTKVFLTLKKKNGTIEEIVIERDEVIVDESFARSVMVDLDGIEDIGYISLPVFYSTFDGGNSCAQDVAEELTKLKANGAKGVILDLRYNGGGSLQDVIDMSGLFIENGPIVQVKARNGQAQVYEDRNASVLYDGPLVVLVNGISASASEILAGALQDYDRAIIVGSKSTFGKGSVQGFFDLDEVYSRASDLKPLGQVKVTTQLFYKVDGGSNQLKGIIPDINLPDIYDDIDIGEKEYETALAWSKISEVPHSQNVYNIPNMDQLRTQSANRVATNEAFKLIAENAKYLKEVEDETSVPLDLSSYQAYKEEREKLANQYDDVMADDISGLVIANLPQDISYIEADSSRIARNKVWIEGLHKDVYLEEAARIINDMVSLKP